VARLSLEEVADSMAPFDAPSLPTWFRIVEVACKKPGDEDDLPQSEKLPHVRCASGLLNLIDSKDNAGNRCFKRCIKVLQLGELLETCNMHSNMHFSTVSLCTIRKSATESSLSSRDSRTGHAHKF
jgi:hypothetical protein